MGRKLYRVPLTFDWPINEIWKGYLPPKSVGDDDNALEHWYAHDRYAPPTGDGYQLWETTTEGSPQSPIFATLDELAAWCEQHATTFADFRATAAEWKRMLGGEGLGVHTREGNVIFL